MSFEPLVSVIINCFNGDKFLKQAIDSVYAQTYQNWEIIFWDNCSTDNSAKIAKGYNQKLRYYKSEQNTNIGIARVEATNRANGKYIAIIDCDDIWLPEKLEQQIKIFSEDINNIGLVYGRSEIIYEDNKTKNYILHDGIKLPEGKIFKDLLEINYIVCSSSIVNREFFYECGGFPKHLKNSTDYWTFLEISRRYHIRAFQKVCCKYRFHSNNLQSTQLIIAAKENIECISRYLPKKEAKNALKKASIILSVGYLKRFDVLNALYSLSIYKGWFLFIKFVYLKLFTSKKVYF